MDEIFRKQTEYCARELAEAAVRRQKIVEKARYSSKMSDKELEVIEIVAEILNSRFCSPLNLCLSSSSGVIDCKDCWVEFLKLSTGGN